MNDLMVLEKQLEPLAPRFQQVLGSTMPVERLIRTVVISVERLPKLLECDRQSLFNAAMSAACLGLEVDGVTGQAFLIPFKDKAQLVIGYKGMATLAARSGITITGAVVREGDEFVYELGTHASVKHVPVLGNNGRIVAAWACAAAHGRPPITVVLGIDELMSVKARSPGAKRSDSPWNDPHIGFPAMCEKTAKRRLARSLPLNVMTAAARMEEAVEEQGAAAWISPDRGLVIEGAAEPSPTPTAAQLIEASPGPAAPADKPAPSVPPLDKSVPSGAGEIPPWEDYVDRWAAILPEATSAKQLAETWNGQKRIRNLITWPDDNTFADLKARVEAKINLLKAAA